MTSIFFACENLKSDNLTFHKIWQIFSWLPLFCILFKFQVGSGDDLHKLGLFSHCRMSRQIYNIPSFSVPFTQYSKLKIWKYIFDCLIKLHFVSFWRKKFLHMAKIRKMKPTFFKNTNVKNTILVSTKLVSNFNFQVLLFLQPDGVHHWHFKLCLLDLKEIEILKL